MRNIYFLLCFLLLLIGCKEHVDVEYDDFEKKLNINSSFAVGDTIIKVRVNYSCELGDDYIAPVESAAVDLYIDEMLYDRLSYDVFDEIYYTYIDSVMPEKSYSCIVKVNEDSVRCAFNMPAIPAIYDASLIEMSGVDEEGTSYPAIEFTFENNLAEDAYYEVVLKTGGILYPLIYEIIDPILLQENLPLALFSNKNIEGSSYTMRINFSGNERNNGNGIWFTILLPTVIELRAVTYDYYLFKRDLYLYDNSNTSNIFIGSIAAYPIHSNIENGYGIFTGYAPAVYDTLYPSTWQHDNKNTENLIMKNNIKR